MGGNDDSLRLDGKVALVTGAARGIGAECARVLARAGAKVMLTDLGAQACAGVVAEIRAAGGHAKSMALDVTREDDWVAGIAHALESLGGLDVLVNNAGIEIVTAVTETSIEDFRRIFAVNVEGVFLGVKHAVLAMRPGGRAGRGGSIINISSVAGLVGLPWLSAYGATKGAVRIFTKDVAIECGRMNLGIRCNSVHPGVVRTELAESFLHKMQKHGVGEDVEQAREIFRQAHPIGHMGEPMDIANAIRFLASDASRWITGTELVVDGGYTAA